ncbi:MAG: 50S ribosomal protein L4 [Vicinamibacterales bacterium]
MTVDVVNVQNEKVGSLALSDEVFGRRAKPDVVWEAVRHEQAASRRGTHATKTRGLVAGSGRKLWKQKGTGRARVSDVRNPIWRKGGTVFGPQPRDYDYALPKKVRRGAVLSAVVQKLTDAAVVVVDDLALGEAKTKAAAALLKGLGVTGKALVVDVHPGDAVVLAMRNLPGVTVRASGRVTARDVVDASQLVVTRAAMEHWQGALA